MFSVRWYHECNEHGEVLSGFQNRACVQWFYLPTNGEAHAEPVELVSNHAVIEALQMRKVTGHLGVWEGDKAHLKCIKAKFGKLVKAAGGKRK